MLTTADFPEFFAEMYDGAQPYSWQVRTLEQLIDDGRWPESIVAPTGSGKSAVADIHVFARALAVQNGLAIPRRLVLVVGRRALVDSQADHARVLQQRLASPTDGSVMESVASHLESERFGGDGPLSVSVIRGGLTPDRGWIDQPTQTQILCMTPDMFGSRLLFRGYGESRSARPRSAGLLSFDTAVVIDESHLNVQLSATVRRVREIVREAPVSDSIPPLQIVETTATPQPSTPTGITVSEDSLDLARESDRQLSVRLTATKTPTLVGLSEWPLPKTGTARSDALETIVQSAVDLRSDAGGTVGVILNRIADAVAVAERLKKAQYRTVLRVGPMQPLKGLQVASEHPTLLTPEGDSSVDFLVATQTIEVGVDIDLHGMVTEIASAPALVQRLGRVNRRGRYARADVVVVGPSEGVEVTAPAPYTEEEIREARAWLADITSRLNDLSPASLAHTVIPAGSSRRLLLEKLAIADVEQLSHTSEELFVEPDLDIWLHDELGTAEQNVGVIGRVLPSSPELRLPLLNLTPPQSHEIYPATFGRIRRAFEEEKKRRQRRRSSPGSADETYAYIFRDSQWLAFEENQRLKAGDVICFPHDAAHAMEGVFLPSTGADALGDSLSVWRSSPEISDQLPWPRQLVLHESTTDDPMRGAPESTDSAAVLFHIEQAVKDGDDPTLAVVDERMAASGRPGWLTDIFGDMETDVSAIRLDVAPQRSNGSVAWAVLTLESPSHLEEESRQEWTPSGQVRLSEHQRDVEARAERLAGDVGLMDSLTNAITTAARHHDDGKAHPFFQLRLGNRSQEGVLLAKSGRRKNLSRSRTGSDGLPIGWRHEQYSVLLNADEDWPLRDLILRLIGTTHGHGRCIYKQSAQQLCTGIVDETLTARADELFAEGEWDELMEKTDMEHRWWGAAYLEAILRAADCQVSGEGR